jgi:hypothetical protein
MRQAALGRKQPSTNGQKRPVNRKMGIGVGHASRTMVAVLRLSDEISV